MQFPTIQDDVATDSVNSL